MSSVDDVVGGRCRRWTMSSVGVSARQSMTVPYYWLRVLGAQVRKLTEDGYGPSRVHRGFGETGEAVSTASPRPR